MKINVEMEMSEDTKKPICFLLWEMDMINQVTSLVGVITNRVKAEKYSKYVRECAKRLDRRIRVHIEEREMDHLFGFSVIDEVGLPLKEEPK